MLYCRTVRPSAIDRRRFCASLGVAASLGGDTDTIAAMLGAILGACAGYRALPQDLIDTVRRVNRLDLDPLVGQLLALRARSA